MNEEMSIYYDEEGDLLEISIGDISNCYFDNMGNGTFRIIDKETRKVKGIVIHNFKKRTKKMISKLKGKPRNLGSSLKMPITYMIYIGWQIALLKQKRD